MQVNLELLQDLS